MPQPVFKVSQRLQCMRGSLDLASIGIWRDASLMISSNLSTASLIYY